MNRKQIMSFSALLLILTLGFSSCYVGYQTRGPGPRHHHHHHRGYR